MKNGVLITADLHLDMWLEAGRNPFDLFGNRGFDAMIIAGDLTNKPKVRWKQALEIIGQCIDLERVFIVPGNHDYYHHALDGDDRLEQIARDAGANFAQKREIIFGNKRYLCCTLWTDFQEGQGTLESRDLDARAKMNDYRYIRVASAGYRKARPADTIARHREHLSWLRSKLVERFDGETAVVTHHAPIADVLPAGQKLSWCYASDLKDLILEYQPADWFFGHTHHRTELLVGKTRIMNVSIGYPLQNMGGAAGGRKPRMRVYPRARRV
ncbi:Icc-related predicted phosphoesterase [Thioclava sp. ES.031]|uniref:metallophosphoesterase n=1 Tax=Thioclava sp. ES.031 TaxID=1798203 RepID=UPI000BF6E65B|nr:metallophosphoesterase [Thioclava sp. ES.031]PFG62166.1 Icc-related predicted phosphoesterase [Thioclava sp. ES.031]